MIHIVTKGLTSEAKTIKPILDYLNQNEYFESLKVVAIENNTVKMKKNEEMILQINKLLDKFSATTDSKGDKLVYYSENAQLNDILKTKNNLVTELGERRAESINIDAVIKKNSSIINIKNTSSVNGNLKFLLPIFLVFGFVFINLFSKFYKRQLLKSKLQAN